MTHKRQRLWMRLEYRSDAELEAIISGTPDAESVFEKLALNDPQGQMRAVELAKVALMNRHPSREALAIRAQIQAGLEREQRHMMRSILETDDAR